MSPTIGAQLKQAREARGLTLEQAAHATRLRLHYLRALEEDQREVLPSEVQGRGFLRLYADFLGLPVQPLLDAWKTNQVVIEALPPAKVEAPTVTEPVKEESVAPEVVIAPEPPPPAVINPPTTPRAEIIAPTAESRQILQQIGAELKQQREGLSLSLADIEKHIHVRQHYLKALEEGRFEVVPSPVQARGMLSNYASFLNLDTENMLLRFAEALQTRRTENLPAAPQGRSAAKPRAAKAPGWTRFLTPDLLIGGTLVIVLVVVIIWSTMNISAIGTTPATQTAPSISDVLLTTTPLALPTSDLPVTESTGISPEMPGDATVPTLTLAPLNTDPMQIVVIGLQRTYLKVTVDGAEVFSGRVVPGNAYNFSGSEQIELITGNAAGVQIFYNQSDLGTLGAIGQVVSFIFTPGEVITPTPSFTATSPATPTPTPTPTLTPTPGATPTVTQFVP
ncbi:MAG TPA: DUF4115 domain-containing protein [Anaerolineaceae bacterium]|nr:DUF4115 domain-containing protein [Anaerolineaceae bacterium]